jgi:hypothetical protein
MKVSELKCSVCGKGIFETPLYRNGPMGVIGVEQRCIEHVDDQYRPDKETVELCDFISGNTPTERKEEGQQTNTQQRIN